MITGDNDAALRRKLVGVDRSEPVKQLKNGHTNHLSDGIEKLVFDLGGLEYISSAGLRVLVDSAQIIDEQGGNMVIRNLSVPVRDVFDVTDFIDAFDIE